MNIQDALKETGKAKRAAWAATYVKLFKTNSLIQYDRESGEVLGDITFDEYFRTDWQPYHPVEQIVPREAGELWSNDAYIYFTVNTIIPLDDKNLKFCNSAGAILPINKNYVHNQNGWARIHPPVDII